MKKIISVALALVMILGCCSLMAFAVTTKAALEISVEPKEATYKKGDIVTFEVFYEAFSNELVLNAPARIYFGYDSSVFEPIEDLSADINAWSTIKTVVYKDYIIADSVNAEMSSSSVKHNPAILSAVDKAKGWDSTLMSTVTTAIGSGYDFSTKTPVFAFKLKVREDASDVGSYTVGVTDYCKNSEDPQTSLAVCEVNGDLMGGVPDATEWGFPYKDMFALNDATVKVASSTPAGPAVSKAKSQVKMTATGKTTVADEFSFRVISKISDSDWDTYFKNTGVEGAKTDYITAVGMVAYKGAAAFDAETAKKVVAGSAAENYTAATTDYISKVSDTADAEFGAIIKANHSTLNNDVTYMGFVQYVDASGNAQTIFYETAGTAALSTNYNNIVSAYLARYPFAA